MALERFAAAAAMMMENVTDNTTTIGRRWEATTCRRRCDLPADADGGRGGVILGPVPSKGKCVVAKQNELPGAMTPAARTGNVVSHTRLLHDFATWTCEGNTDQLQQQRTIQVTQGVSNRSL
jgi:hypothetical protein